MVDFTYRILVVDDDPLIRDTSEAVLAKQGYEVRTAADGFEALRIMRKALPDIVISDLKMPNMSGFELLSILRRRFPNIPVIVISGEFYAVHGPAVLADVFLQKGGYSPHQLFTEISRLLAESPMRPYPNKPDQTPVWIARNGRHIVITCTACLRSFSLRSDKVTRGVQERECTHCGVRLKFILEPAA